MVNKVKELDTFRKSDIQKNKTLYKSIIDYNKNFDPSLKWGQLIWHFYNKIDEIPKCSCGNTLHFKSPIQGYREYCSRSCMYKSDLVKNKRKDTFLEKYGVDNISKLESTKSKVRKTNIDNFGVNYPLENIEVLNRNKKYFTNKYGVDNPSKLDEVKIKRRETKLRNHGNENYVNIEKSLLTKYQRYGDSKYNNRDKFKNTMVENHGVDNPLKSKDILNKVKKTNIERYGREFFVQTEEYQIMMERGYNRIYDSGSKKYFLNLKK